MRQLDIFSVEALFFRHKHFRDFRRFSCDPVRLSCLRTPFFVARYPGFEEREVRNVKNASESCENIFLTLNIVFFQRLIYLSVAKKVVRQW